VVVVGGEVDPVPADTATMAAVARITSGSSFEAESAGELRSVYEDIGERVGSVVEQREVARTFLGVAVATLLAAVAASLLWTVRLL
jgi:Ca-activated chloride channel family protein